MKFLLPVLVLTISSIGIQSSVNAVNFNGHPSSPLPAMLCSSSSIANELHMIIDDISHLQRRIPGSHKLFSPIIQKVKRLVICERQIQKTSASEPKCTELTQAISTLVQNVGYNAVNKLNGHTIIARPDASVVNSSLLAAELVEMSKLKASTAFLDSLDKESTVEPNPACRNQLWGKIDRVKETIDLARAQTQAVAGEKFVKYMARVVESGEFDNKEIQEVLPIFDPKERDNIAANLTRDLIPQRSSPLSLDFKNIDSLLAFVKYYEPVAPGFLSASLELMIDRIREFSTPSSSDRYMMQLAYEVFLNRLEDLYTKFPEGFNELFSGHLVCIVHKSSEFALIEEAGGTESEFGFLAKVETRRKHAGSNLRCGWEIIGKQSGSPSQLYFLLRRHAESFEYTYDREKYYDRLELKVVNGTEAVINNYAYTDYPVWGIERTGVANTFTLTTNTYSSTPGAEPMKAYLCINPIQGSFPDTQQIKLQTNLTRNCHWKFILA